MKYREIWKVYNKVFDLNTLEVLEELKKDGFIKEELIPISEGKEAIVFKSDKFAIKIYKVNDISYKEQLRYLEADPRFRKFPRSRIGIIYTWVKKEYLNLSRMYKNLIPVPSPYLYRKNVLVMEFIGDEKPAPLLKYYFNYIENKKEFFENLLDIYKKIYKKSKLIHGDFSEYNLLVYKNSIYVIDVSQAIPIHSKASDQYLIRDMKNILNISKQLGLKYELRNILEYLEIELEITDIYL